MVSISDVCKNQLRVKVELGDGLRLAYFSVRDSFLKLNGPAVIWDTGGKEWFIYNNYCRDDGPVVVYKNGCRKWWVDGRLIERTM